MDVRVPDSFEDEQLAIGTRVQVRNRYLADFAPGFVVDEVTAGGYLVRRVSDGARLPMVFAAEDVRPDTVDANALR